MISSENFGVKDLPLLISLINAANTRLDLLNSLPSVKGYLAEEYVASLTGGRLTSYSDAVDVTLKDNNRRRVTIEVKFSSIVYPSKISPTTKRWKWTAPLGYKDYGKIFDYLVLIGEKEDKTKQLFLFGYSEINPILCLGSCAGSNVQANVDKDKARNTGALIWDKAITPENLSNYFSSLGKDLDIVLLRSSKN